jgi:anaerobic ribonucleoside-triphosphate reductase-activating protein
VLVDGPYVEAERDISLPWAGSRNQRVVDVKKSLEKEEVVLWQK